jgi:Arc/MetJ family transcription regulator
MHMVIVMRTNIMIDDVLMNDVLKIIGLKTKREAVELGLRKLLELKRQEQIKAFKGKLKWKGNLNAQRMDHDDERGESE